MEIESAAALQRPMNRLDATDKGVGREGRKLKSIVANMWRIKAKGKKGVAQIFLYNVDFSVRGRVVRGQEQEKKYPAALLRRVMRLVFEQHRARCSTDAFAFDGGHYLYSVQPLFLDEEGAAAQASSFDVTVPPDEGGGSAETWVVEPKMITLLNTGNLDEWFRNTKTDMPAEILQALNEIVRSTKADSCIVTSRSVFDPMNSGAAPIFGGYHLWRGWYQSVRPVVQGLVINVDLNFSAFLHEQSAIDLVQKILAAPNGTPFDARKSLAVHHFNLLTTEMRGVKFWTTHTGHKMTQTIERISGLADQISFEHDGHTVTVANYFRQKYGIALKYMHLPLIQVKRKNGFSYVPLELATIQKNQRRTRLVTPRQAQDVIKLAAVRPGPRLNQLREILRGLDLNRGLIASQVISCDSEPMPAPNARLLPPPAISYAQNKIVQPSDGAWNIRNCSLTACTTPLRAYGVLDLTDMRPDNVRSFFLQLSDIGRASGYSMSAMSDNLYTQARGFKPGVFARLYKAVIQRFKECQLIFVLVDNPNPEPYRSVKLLGDTQIGVVTQVLTKRVVQGANAMSCAQIIQKLNYKVGQGGKNHVTVMPRNPALVNSFENRPFMLLGADVTHPPPGSGDSNPSIASLCATIDRNMVRYVGDIRIQVQQRQEPILTIADMLPSLLSRFRATQRSMLPETIIMFRDGVGEGMQEAVFGAEIDQIRKGCRSVDPRYSPKLTYVLCNKRHHTRFFAKDRAEADKNGNCLPGTVIDTDVTNPQYFEFYHFGAFALQGTAKPTLYRVLYDECKFSPDQLQNLVNRLVHSYGRCTRSVSMVPPAYYAHHLATRGRCYTAAEGETAMEARGAGGPVYAMPSVQDVIKGNMFWI